MLQQTFNPFPLDSRSPDGVVVVHIHPSRIGSIAGRLVAEIVGMSRGKNGPTDVLGSIGGAVRTDVAYFVYAEGFAYCIVFL